MIERRQPDTDGTTGARGARVAGGGARLPLNITRGTVRRFLRRRRSPRSRQAATTPVTPPPLFEQEYFYEKEC